MKVASGAEATCALCGGEVDREAQSEKRVVYLPDFGGLLEPLWVRVGAYGVFSEPRSFCDHCLRRCLHVIVQRLDERREENG